MSSWSKTLVFKFETKVFNANQVVTIKGYLIKQVFGKYSHIWVINIKNLIKYSTESKQNLSKLAQALQIMTIL